MRALLRFAAWMASAPSTFLVESLSRTAPRSAARLLVHGLVVVCLAGCSSIHGVPDRLYPIGTETEFVRSVAGPEWYSQYAQATGTIKKQLRDQIVLSRMYAADLYYSEYEAQLTRERQNVGFFSTVANLALTSSATLVTVKETKTILSAVATGLTGTKEAYEKDILIEKTIAILQSQMRARRKEIKVTIIDRLGLDVSSYPLELALTDLETYYRAGTITGALIDVSEDVGVRLREARNVESQMVVTKFAPLTADVTTRIRVYWNSTPGKKKAVEDWLKTNNINMPVAFFLRSSANTAEQRRMIRELGIP